MNLEPNNITKFETNFSSLRLPAPSAIAVETCNAVNHNKVDIKKIITPKSRNPLKLMCDLKRTHMQQLVWVFVCVCARASSCNFIGIYNNHNPSIGVFQHGCKMLRQKIHMELPFNIANCLHIKTDNVNWTNAYMRVLCLTVFQWFFSEKSHHVGLNFAPWLKATNQLKDWLHSFACPCMTR